MGWSGTCFFSPLQCLARCQLFGSLSRLFESLLRASLLYCCCFLSAALICNLESWVIALTSALPCRYTSPGRTEAGGLANRRLRAPGVQGCLRRGCRQPSPARRRGRATAVRG